MSTSPTYYGTEITPERIAEITRRAHHERSQAMWRLLEGIFKSRASDELPHTAGSCAKTPRLMGATNAFNLRPIPSPGAPNGPA